MDAWRGLAMSSSLRHGLTAAAIVGLTVFAMYATVQIATPPGAPVLMTLGMTVAGKTGKTGDVLIF